MKRDILFLSQYYVPERINSATYPHDTAKYLAQHGFKVHTLCGSPKEYSYGDEDVPMREVLDGVGLRRIKYIQASRVRKLGRLINYFSFTASTLLHIFGLRKYKCVVVYSNPPILPYAAILANKLFGTKIVFIAYDIYPEVAYASGSIEKGSFMDRGMKAINRQLYKRASAVVALTDEMKQFLLDNRPELTEDRVFTISNWAHEQRGKADDAAYERFGISRDDFIVSYFGNMGICQDMDTLINAAARLRDNNKIKFMLAGHGSKLESIRRRIAEEKLENVMLLDFLKGEAFEQALAIASCCVVSLERGIKGMCAPSKLYSYIRNGKPVLAIAEEGSYLTECVSASNVGLAANVGDDAKLAANIERLSKDPVRCREMGENAFTLYNENYDIEIAMAKYKDMFEKIL